MKTLHPSVIIKSLLAAAAVALMPPSGQAATYPFSVTNSVLGPNPATFTMAEVDPFTNNGTIGNTVLANSPSSPFCTVTATSGWWYYRSFAGLTLRANATGLANMVEADGAMGLNTSDAALTGGSSTLLTTINGLPAGTYEVYAVVNEYTSQGMGGSLQPVIYADLATNGATTPFTPRSFDTNSITTGRTASTWQIILQPLGQVTGTSFSVLVDAVPGAANRGDYYGLAYRLAPNQVSFATQPLPQSSPTGQTEAVLGGTNVMFSAVGLGAPPLSYQWLKNGTAIAGATNNTLIFPSVQTSDAALYSVVLTNAYSSLTSSVAPLNVLTPTSASTITMALGASGTWSFVAPDAFLSGGAAGNTVEVANPSNAFAVQGATVPSYWDWRNFASLDLYYQQFGHTTSDYEVYETSGAAQQAPTLRTTISGLAAGVYEVCVVHLAYDNGGTLPGLLANIDPTGTGTTATTLVEQGANTLYTGLGVQPASVPPYVLAWDVALEPLGSVQANGGNISVLVGDAGSVVSRGDYLGVAYQAEPLGPPSILTQPANSVTYAGSNVIFSVSALANPLPQYQWLKNGVAISGATASAYTIASPQSTDAGFYSVIVTNSYGRVLSSNAFLNIFAPTGPDTVDITLNSNATVHFVSADAFVNGGSAGNTVMVTNTALPFATLNATTAGYWDYRNFANLNLFGGGIPTAALLETSSTYIGPNLLTTLSGLPSGNKEIYLVQIASSSGTSCGLLADIASAGMTAPITPRINAASLAPGTINTYLTAPTSPTWEVVLTPLGQVTGTSLQVLVGYLSGQNRGDYIGLAYGPPAAGAPSISSQPLSQTAFATTNTTFTVSASGTPSPTYQWFKNGLQIAGATNSALNFPSPQASDAGVYSLVVSNAYGIAWSSNATLNVFTYLPNLNLSQSGAVQMNLGTNEAYYFVPVDAFVPGGTTGNTVALANPSSPFAQYATNWVDGYWDYDNYYGMCPLGGSGVDPTAPNMLTVDTNYWGANSGNCPTLQTTVANLPSSLYQVYLVQAEDTLGWDPELYASIQTGGLTAATGFEDSDSATVHTGLTVPLPYGFIQAELVMNPLGSVNGTGFSVLVSPVISSGGEYFGLAFQYGAAVLSAVRTGNQVQISWTGPGTLQSATKITGPYTSISGATSPYLTTPTAPQVYYRVVR